MTIKEIKQLIKGLPDTTEVMAIDNEGRTVPIVLGGRQLTITDKESTIKVWLEI